MTEPPFAEFQLAWQDRLSEAISGAIWSPDGRGWAAIAADGSAIWNRGTSTTHILQAADNRALSQIAFSHDRRWLTAGGEAGIVSIWDCQTDRDLQHPPQLVKSLNCDRWIERLAWHPTQPSLAIGYGSQLEIWDLSTVTKTGCWQFANSICDLSWHPAGKYLAIAGAKGIQLWTPPAPISNVQQIAVATASLNLAWSPDGRYLAVGNLDLTLMIIDLLDPNDPWTLHGCSGKIRQLAWMAGTSTPCLAVASERTISIWELTSDRTNWDGRLLEGHQDRVLTLAPHPHLPILASGGADGYICLWSLAGDIERILADGTSQITSVDWHPDAVYLIAGNRAGKIELWSIPA